MDPVYLLMDLIVIFIKAWIPPPAIRITGYLREYLVPGVVLFLVSGSGCQVM